MCIYFKQFVLRRLVGAELRGVKLLSWSGVSLGSHPRREWRRWGGGGCDAGPGAPGPSLDWLFPASYGCLGRKKSQEGVLSLVMGSAGDNGQLGLPNPY